MLAELAVRNLGVISSARLVLGGGMTALTGETGAGKTLVVQAVQLLMGGRAGPAMVRAGADEAVVEGRFVSPDGAERLLRRVIPAAGRSRAYLDGAMASAPELAELGIGLVDLHGQHQHQSLLRPRTQRDALDRWGGIDLRPLRIARDELRALADNLRALGGDARARVQEMDLLRYQVDEISSARLDDPGELEQIAAQEDLLADAAAHLVDGHAARSALSGDDGAIDRLGSAAAALAGRKAFALVHDRLSAAAAEMDDTVTQLRGVLDAIEDDPRALAEVRARHQLLRELTRKYGDTLSEVAAFGARAAERLSQLERHAELASELEEGIAAAQLRVGDEAQAVASARRAAAPGLAEAVRRHLTSLALASGTLEVCVAGDPPSDGVELLFSANRDSPPGPLSKAASGGELARVMLALRLVLTDGPPTLVFDEVDAGIGGEAALAVGQALVSLTEHHQVVVVTHLPQVAAFAHHHVAVRKSDDGVSVASDLVVVSGTDRVTELARMLSGQPSWDSGRQHASDLLESAAAQRPHLQSAPLSAESPSIGSPVP
ncbi:DNA repair protein RecN [Candidatus Poriferisodalis sp.]|uniref:DNA repair protein RecN n=1 Tax=Candidatus Poriferisodalis sp. TaxID=3101277 RepID=UPI003B0129C4